MRRFAVLGNPIEHSKSPEIHRAFADSCRHDIDYRKVLVEAGQFDTVVNDFFARGGIGLNVTAPFKGEAFEFAEVHTSDAIDAQAVNTLWRDDQGRICGHTTDGSGLARDLEGIYTGRLPVPIFYSWALVALCVASSGRSAIARQRLFTSLIARLNERLTWSRCLRGEVH